MTVPQRRGDALIVGHDEGVRGETTIESLAGLRPAFDTHGHITAGNASQISDGASAMVITTAEVADRLGVTPLAEIIGYGQVAGPDASLLHQPSRAIKAALDRAGLSVGDVDLFEINEAFAAVGVASADDLGISMDIVNVNGGAIAVAIPSACPATASPCTSRSSSPDAAAASAPRPCAAAAARATPSCCA